MSEPEVNHKGSSQSLVAGEAVRYFLTAHKKGMPFTAESCRIVWPQVKARTVQILLITWETEVMAQQISYTDATGIQKGIG